MPNFDFEKFRAKFLVEFNLRCEMIRMLGRDYEAKQFVDEVVKIAGDGDRTQHDRDYVVDCLCEWAAQLSSVEVKHWLDYCRADSSSRIERLIHHWICVAANFSREGSGEFSVDAVQSINWIVEHDPSAPALCMPMAFDFEREDAQQLDRTWRKVVIAMEQRRVKTLENALEFYRGHEEQAGVLDELEKQISMGQQLVQVLEKSQSGQAS